MSKNLTVVEYVINRLADLGIDRAFGVFWSFSLFTS
jgi:TPP-dependent 2-oxoacid decarboxylase